MASDESVKIARYRLKMARQAVRHSNADAKEARIDLKQAKLALKDAKIQVREHTRRGRAVVEHERRRSKGLLESRAAYERRMRIEQAEEAPLR